MNTSESTSHEVNLMRSIARLDTRFEVLHQDVTEVKGAMNKLAEAMTKLAIIEERQGQASQAVERAFSAIVATQAETAALKLQLAASQHHANSATKWIDRALIALVACGAGFIMRGGA